MGLDMYLSKKTYVQNWDHTPDERRYKITIKKGGKACKEIKPKRITYIEEEVMYWRKANAIHAWFVKNCQDGNDDCRDAYVSSEKLKELRDVCQRVIDASVLVEGKIKNGKTMKNGEWEDIIEDGKYIKDATVAHELLPTTSGFFFGSTEYDEYYFEDVKDTLEGLDKLIAEDPDAEYRYHASW